MVCACCVCAGNVRILVCIHFDTVYCAYHNLNNKQQAGCAAYALYACNTGILGRHCFLTSVFNSLLPCRACQDTMPSPRSPRACTMTTWANAATWSSLDLCCKQPLRHVRASLYDFHPRLLGSNNRPVCLCSCSAAPEGEHCL